MPTDPATPWPLVLAFGLPPIAVVAWFLARLFGGRWPDDHGPDPDPWRGPPARDPEGGRDGVEAPVREDEVDPSTRNG